MTELYWALRRFADFSGRSSRKEYWLFVLNYLVFSLAMLQLKTVAFFGQILLGQHAASGLHQFVQPNEMRLFLAAANLVFFGIGLLFVVPSLSILVRRLHDSGRSMVWSLLLLPIGLTQIMAAFYRFVISQSFFGNSRAAWGLLMLVAKNPFGAAWMAATPVLMAVGAIGGLILVVLLCLPGTRGDNRFGPPSTPVGPDPSDKAEPVASFSRPLTYAAPEASPRMSGGFGRRS